jgi:hypothetical protein
MWVALWERERDKNEKKQYGTYQARKENSETSPNLLVFSLLFKENSKTSPHLPVFSLPLKVSSSTFLINAPAGELE